jgi:hypothetical protein
MKVGDLVLMRFASAWQLNGGKSYTDKPLLVIEEVGEFVEVLNPVTGEIICGMKEYYEVLSENA